MKKLLYILIGVLMLSACSSGVDTKDMSEIEQLLAVKDYEAAQSMCDDIVDDADLKAIDLQSLCKLSIYYVKLSDNQHQEENMAKATSCYKAATEINADSVSAFMAELPLDDAQYAMLLKNLSGMIGAPIEIDAEEPIESECSGDCDNCEDKCDAADVEKKAESDKKAKAKKDQPKKKKENKKKESSKSQKKKE